MSSTASTTRVPLLDLKPQYAPLSDAIQQAIRDVCDSQQFILGPRVAELEREIAAYSQCPHGIGVSSGTDALLVALMALGIGAGDAVITTPYTFFGTAGVIARVGARPIFCDIEPYSYNLSADCVAGFIDNECDVVSGRLVEASTGATVKALMPVHLYGQMAPMDALLAQVPDGTLAVIEDAAQALGAETPDGRRAGSLGDVGCFSFFPTKNLGAFGDAGMCVTGDAELAQKLKVLRVHGGEPKYYHSLIGGNFRLDELQAAVLLVKLQQLDAWTEGRQQNAAHYDRLLAGAGLNDFVRPPSVDPGARHVFNQYVIRVSDRDALREHLGRCGIGTEIYYPLALHEQACFASLGYAPGDLPNASRAARETLALPIYPELAAQQLEYVVESITAYYRGHDVRPLDL